LAAVGEVEPAKQLIERLKEEDRDENLKDIENLYKSYQFRVKRYKECKDPVIVWEASAYYSLPVFTGKKSVDSKEFLEEFKREIDASERPGQLADIIDRYSTDLANQAIGRFYFRLADDYCK